MMNHNGDSCDIAFNIFDNPSFADSIGLSLAESSACINAGDPASPFRDACFPPSFPPESNDIGACGGPGACAWLPITSVDHKSLGVPGEYLLSQNYPNPFNPSTTIKYGLPCRAHVVLTVYNTLGQQVAVLVDEIREAGYHELVFKNPGLASGVYLYRLQTGDFVSTKKLLILK